MAPENAHRIHDEAKTHSPCSLIIGDFRKTRILRFAPPRQLAAVRWCGCSQAYRVTTRMRGNAVFAPYSELQVIEMTYFYLVVAMVLNALANMLLKQGAAHFGGLGEPHLVQRVLHNPPLLAGLLLFALNVVFYLAALYRLNLSVAYPVMVAGGLVIVTLGSAVWLRETVTVLQWGGIGLLTLGIVLVTWGPTA
jgi:multidrug transporter EmrE-like cation transporter